MTGFHESRMRPSTSLLFILALSMTSNFTMTASIFDTMLPIECSMRSTRRTSLTTTNKEEIHLLVVRHKPVNMSKVVTSDIYTWNSSYDTPPELLPRRRELCPLSSSSSSSESSWLREKLRPLSGLGSELCSRSKSSWCAFNRY